MFFLITHILIGKYYSNIFTQFIIGCVLYVVSALIIHDIVSEKTYQQYKYYALFLIAADTTFIIYKAKTSPKTKEKEKIKDGILENSSDLKNSTNSENIKNIENMENIANDSTNVENPKKLIASGRNENMQTLTLSSEIDDFKIVHDLSLSESDNKNSIFSTSNESKKIE